MALNTGTKLGAYEIAGLLGTGGMGEVYRARDSRLKRDVAIKVLPDGFSRDPESIARFRREAEVLASLNHPHIAVIYDFAESASSRFLVMELVEGETLADRLKTGAIPVDESLSIAQQIAEALEAAHEKGIVHRDLKPANIRITPEGRVKVLDFGLAKIQEVTPGSPDFANSPTVMGATGTGVILGTMAYMSPEQARGKAIDKRTDIWAFGVLLFEMLSGKRAFPGDSMAEIMASVLTRDVDLQALPPALPTRIVDMLRRCLQRDASRRLRDIGDAKLEIEEAAAPGITIAPPSAISKRGRGLTLAVAAAALIAGALVGFGLNARSSSDTPSWTGTRLGGPRVAMYPRISPNGTTLAFFAFVDGLTQVAVMNPESGDWKVRTEDRTRGSVLNMSWSPDSARLYYDRFNGSNRAIFSIPAFGGEERLIKENAFVPLSLPDGSLLVLQINERRETQIYRYWPQENREAPLPALIKSLYNYHVRVFPNGKQAVFWGTTPQQPSTDSEEHLYLMDIEKQTSIKMPVNMQPTSVINALAVTLDNKSVVVAVANGDLSRVVAMPVDAAGPPQTLINLQGQLLSTLDVGPDGSIYADQSSRPAEILRFGVSGEDLRRLAVIPNPVLAEPPLHLPDGRTLLTVVIAGHRRLVIATPGKDPTPFVEGDEETGTPAAFLGKDRVAFMIGKAKEKRIAIASLDGGRILRRLQSLPASGISAMTASPDGKTIYFVESGKVWSIPDEDGTRREIHAGDGVAVAPDGKSLIIQLAQVGKVEWVRVDVESGNAQPIAVKEAAIFPIATPPGPNAVGPDGRILMAVTVPDFWFFPPAIFNPKTGDVQRIPIRYEADMFTPGWTPDGKIIAVGHTFESTIWRFRPTR